ncbi:MAG: VCBS repeat-containing protein, partial [Micrococcales bacterium]|nr:VCBS repeat-containing protein [Micrococcales bacterium]
ILWFYAGQGNGFFAPKVQIGSSWSTMHMATGVDIDGDGRPDIVARDKTGKLWLYRSAAGLTWYPRVQIGSGW